MVCCRQYSRAGGCGVCNIFLPTPCYYHSLWFCLILSCPCSLCLLTATQQLWPSLLCFIFIGMVCSFSVALQQWSMQLVCIQMCAALLHSWHNRTGKHPCLATVN